MKTITNILAFVSALYGMVISIIVLTLYFVAAIPLFPFMLTKRFKLEENEKWCTTKFINNLVEKVESLI